MDADRVVELAAAWEALPLGAGIWVLVCLTVAVAAWGAAKLIRMGYKMRDRSE